MTSILLTYFSLHGAVIVDPSKLNANDNSRLDGANDI